MSHLEEKKKKKNLPFQGWMRTYIKVSVYDGSSGVYPVAGNKKKYFFRTIKCLGHDRTIYLNCMDTAILFPRDRSNSEETDSIFSSSARFSWIYVRY